MKRSLNVLYLIILFGIPLLIILPSFINITLFVLGRIDSKLWVTYSIFTDLSINLFRFLFRIKLDFISKLQNGSSSTSNLGSYTRALASKALLF